MRPYQDLLPWPHWQFTCFLLLQWSHQSLSQASNPYPVHVSQTACFAQNQRGIVDRSNRNVSIVVRDWVSHKIVTSILEIVLGELVRFNVLVVNASAGATHRFGDEMDSHHSFYEIDAEIWWDDLKNQVENMGPIGYHGRSGLWTFKSMQARSQNPIVPPFVDYYKMYDSATTCADFGYLMFPESSLRGFLGGAFPICNTSSHAWCGKGSLEGYWAPPLCQTNPNNCIEIYMVTPNYDTGYFEQLTLNLGLPAVHGYYGSQLPVKVKSLQNALKTPVFYYWEPSLFLDEVDVLRIHFPDYKFGCDRGDTRLPSGPVDCDYRQQELKKVAALRLRTLVPEAYYSLMKYQVTKAQLEEMMGHMRTHNKSEMDVACDYLRGNPNWIDGFAPHCMIRTAAVPKMGAFYFNTGTLSCLQRSIFPNAPPHGQCFATRPGTVDRSSTVLSLATRDWASQLIVSYLVVIVLEELLGYKVTVLNTSLKGQVTCPEDIYYNLYDIDAEFWHQKNTTSYQTYVQGGTQVFDAGPLGYYGRSGLFTLSKMLTKSKFSTYWKTYRNSSYAAALGFLTFNESQHRPLGQLKEFLGDLFPVCNSSTVQWCTTGHMTGYWVSPYCSAHPELCLEIFMKQPTWDPGYFEQLTWSLGIPAIHSYSGDLFSRRIRTLRNYTSTPIFYGYEPDVFVHEVGAVRISFPNYHRDCNIGTMNPTPGNISCDYQERELAKLVSRTVTQASEAYFFLKGLRVYHDQIDGLLSLHAHANRSNNSRIEFGIACDFLKQRPQWIQRFVPDEIVRPIPLQNLMVGDTWFDPTRLAVVNVSCPLNSSLQINLQANMWSCRRCPDGFKPNQAQTACIDIIMTTQSETDSELYVVVIVCLSSGIIVLGMCLLIRMMLVKHKRSATDSPVRTNTPTGAWVMAWVGPHIHGRLTTGHELRTQLSSPVLATPMGSHRRGEKKKKKAKGWLVNATPFDVSLSCTRTCQFFKFSQCTFTKIKNFDLSWSLQIEVDASDYYSSQSQAIYFDITNMEWQTESTQKPLPIQYECPVLRVALPDTSDGNRMGHIKFVQGPKKVFLICWSPPTELRGMPLPEFEKFLCQCLEHQPPDQEGIKITVPTKTAKLARMATFMPPGMLTSAKSPGEKNRNMYDANENFIRKEIAVKDASYAELLTDCGVPTLFASHVWNVNIGTTLQILKSLDFGSLPRPSVPEQSINGFEDLAADIPHNDVKDLAHVMARRSFGKWSNRIWFCTACNNQSRVQEELGDDVALSPFARVINSNHCQRMLLFSPLDALERKWCNYEFSVAKSAKKHVLLATTDGIVQAGRVAPRALHELAEKAKNFRCEHATCYSEQDETLIDAAVQRVGGYAALNEDLRTVFVSAITDAHVWTSRALDAFQEAPSVSSVFRVNADDVDAAAGAAASAPLTACATTIPGQRLHL